MLDRHDSCREAMKMEISNEWLDGFVRALYIAKKDARVYYFKAPNFTYGLLMPASLFLAFSLAGQMNMALIVSGLPALAIMFGTMSIEAVAIVLEKQTGTFERLLTAPVSFFSLLLGKAISGFLFGLTIGTLTFITIALITGTHVANPVLVLIAVAYSSMVFSALGVLVSAFANWVPEAQMLSNLLRFPMTFLAGTFIPFETMPPQLLIVARLLPLTYCVEAFGIAVTDSTATVTYVIDIFVLALFSFLLLMMASKILQRKLG